MTRNVQRGCIGALALAATAAMTLAQGDTCDLGPTLSLPALESGSTIGLTPETLGTCVTSDGTGGSGWYQVVGTGNQITASLCTAGASADYDSKLRVWGDCPSTVCVTGNDDTCGLASEVSWASANGTTYYIQIHGFGVAEGNFTLSVFEDVAGACCQNDGTCTVELESVCTGTYQGAGTDCSITCPDAFADDIAIPLAYNWNGIVHQNSPPDTEQDQPDAPNGYRSISDRGLRIVDGVPFDLNASGALVPYNFVTTQDTLDIVFLGDRNVIDFGNHAWDGAVNGDSRGVQPDWLPVSDVPSATTALGGGGIVVDASTTIGVIYHASNGGSDFDMTLSFSDATSVTVTLSAPDWFADNNPFVAGPNAGVSTQVVLPGPLSSGDGWPGAGGRDLGGPSNPLTIIEASVTSNSLLAAPVPLDINGKTLTSITFDNKTNANAGVAVFSAGIQTNAGALAIPLDYNFNGIVHTADAFGEQGDPDNPAGYRSISDRGFLFQDGQVPSTSGANLAYEFENEAFVNDVVFLGDRFFGFSPDGDDLGIQPDWLPAGTPVTSAFTPVGSVLMTDTTRLGVTYHAANGGCSFDMTLGFDDASTVTVSLSAPDWFANFNPQPAAPGLGVVSATLVPGPISNGDGFPATFNTDNGSTSEDGLNMVESVVSRDQVLADLFEDISGRTLTSVTFDNQFGGNLAIFAMAVDGTVIACPCEFTGNDTVDISDLLTFLALWFPGDIGSDYNNNGTGGEITDLLAFLACWFQATAGPCQL